MRLVGDFDDEQKLYRSDCFKIDELATQSKIQYYSNLNSKYNSDMSGKLSYFTGGGLTNNLVVTMHSEKSAEVIVEKI